MTSVSRWGLIAGAVGIVTASTPAGAAPGEELAVESQGAVEAAAAQVRAAEAQVQSVDARQSALEREILELKREGDRRGRLTDLLRDSLAAEAEVEAELEALDRARDRFTATVRSTVARLDRALRSLADGLERGSKADRRARARRIRTLLETRRWVLETEKRLKPPPSALPAATDLAVLKVDPLDGPEELREKADFAEDARDKLRAKSAELARLVERRRRTRAIARAARDFAVDVSLFDEELMAVVVQGSGASTDEASRSPTGGEQVGDRFDGNLGSGSAGGPENPGAPGSETDGIPPEFQIPDSGGPSTPADPGPSPGTGGEGGSPVDLSTRNMDPLVLLNLEVDHLSVESVEVEQLEALLQKVERLEALFSARARAMRARARRMDEAPPDE